MARLFQHQQFKSKDFYYSAKNSEPEFVYKRQCLNGVEGKLPYKTITIPELV